MATSKRVLVVEDNLDLAEDLVALLNGDQRSVNCGVSYSVARSMESAQRQLLGTAPFAGVVVDMMLPEDDEALQKVDSLEARRAQVITSWAESAESNRLVDSSRSELAEQIEAIDSAIDELLDPDGGIKILLWLLQQCSPASAKESRIRVPNGHSILPILFLTASPSLELRRLCRELDVERSVRYLTKPVGHEKVLMMVHEFLKS